MGFGSYKISGHSGTEFKHRVLFKDIKNHLRKTHKTNHIPSGNQSTVSPYKYKEGSIFLKIISAFVMLLVFTLVGIASFQYTFNFLSETTDYEQLKKDRIALQKSQFEENRSTNYDYYMEIGDLFYANGNNVAAQSNYKEALKYFKDDYTAYGKYTISLCDQCFKDGENCEGAEEYLDFSRNHQLLDGKKLEHLESLLASATKNYATVQ